MFTVLDDCLHRSTAFSLSCSISIPNFGLPTNAGLAAFLVGFFIHHCRFGAAPPALDPELHRASCLCTYFQFGSFPRLKVLMTL